MNKTFFKVLLIGLCLPGMLSAGINVFGEPELLIYNDGNDYMQPRWSPDGSLVAFTGTNYKGLWVMSLSDAEPRQVTDEAAAGFGFEWSSDSKAIVSRIAKFENKRRYNAVMMMDLEKNETKLLTDYRTMMPGLPHWADADEKVYMFNKRQLEVFASGKIATTLQKQNASKTICFLKNDKIAIGDIETYDYRVPNQLKDERILNLVLSPNKRMVAFEVIGGNMYVMNVDGTGLMDLGRGYRPQWSPDNEYIVYMITTDDGHQITASDIYAIKIDGSEKTNLTNTNDRLEMNPSWSPDGHRIAFDVYDEGSIYWIEISK